MKSKYWTLSVLWAVAFGLSGCSGNNRGTDKSPEKVKVEILQVKPSSSTGSRSYSGIIEAGTTTSVSFATVGTVKTVNFKEGQKIGKGALLGTLDSRSLESAYQSALSVRRQAEDAFNRMKILHERGSLPEMEWVEVQSKLQQAVSAEEMAKKALEDVRLYAPASGIIVDKAIEPGQNIIPGMAICKIASTDGVKFKINIPEREINAVSMGQPMAITIPGAGLELTGTVIEKGAEADAMSRSYPVWLSLSNKDGMLKPGMLGEASAESVSADGDNINMSVPVDALRLSHENRAYLWIVKNGRAEQRFVTIGNYTHDGAVEITEGLQSGDIIVTGGIQKIGNGTEVTYGK